MAFTFKQNMFQPANADVFPAVAPVRGSRGGAEGEQKTRRIGGMRGERARSGSSKKVGIIY